ncbi:MAG: 7TM diverse intracellular signaling domain-containing protein, partial [Candidatus Tectomicrobia bacterium]
MKGRTSGSNRNAGRASADFLPRLSSGPGALLFAMLLLWGCPGQAEVEPLRLGIDMEGASMNQHAVYLEDPQGRLSFAQVVAKPWADRFQPLADGNPNLGISRSAFWVRLEVMNPQPHAGTWHIEAVYPQWDEVTFYQRNADGTVKVVQLGDHTPVEPRPLSVMGYVYRLHMPPASQERLWVRFRYDLPAICNTTLRIWTPEAFTRQHENVLFIIGGIFGAFLLLTIYTLFLGLSIRTSEYFWYVGYMFTIILSLVARLGFGHRFLWPNWPWFTDASPVYTTALFIIMATQVTRVFLHTREHVPINVFLWLLTAASATAWMLYPLGLRGVAVRVLLGCVLLAVLFPGLGLWLYLKGRTEARFYILGWSGWSFAVITGFMSDTGLTPFGQLTRFIPAIGLLTEAVCLSFALVDRINLLRRQKEASELRYRTVFEDSKDVIFITALDGQIEDMSPACLEVLAYSREALRHMNVTALYDNPLVWDSFREQMAQHVAIKDFEVTLRKQDGSAIDCLLTATVRHGVGGAAVGYQGIVRDITQQKQNEQLRTDNLRLQTELGVAQRLQQMILPTPEELAQVEGLDIAAFMQPAEEVGGDYYDVLPHNGRLSIGIGDVSGHGLESGVVMLMTQTAVRTLLTSGETDPVRFLDILNRT